MGTIPGPGVFIRPPEQTSPLESVEKLVQLKSLMQGQQLQQQEMQKNQQALTDNQAQTKAMLAWDGKDPNDLSKLILNNKGSANAAAAAAQHFLTVKDTASQIAQRDAQTGASQLDTVIKQHDQILGALQPANDPKQVPDEQLGAYIGQQAQQLQASGMLKEPQVLQQVQQLTQLAQTNPSGARQALQVVEASLKGSKQQFEDAKSKADAAKSQADADLGQNKLEIIRNYKNNPQLLNSQVDAAAPPNKYGSLNVRTKAMVNQAMSVGDVDAAKKAIEDASQQVGGIEKDVAEKTNPAVQAAELHLATAKKAMEEAISDGDPKAAAKLLIDGTVAPSQLVSSRKPAFAQQAFTTAAQMQPGWSATKADADYKVASSPANVAFFGSAKSLTDKGGTLDQLADAAKDIPHDKIPVFNTVADALKASTGSGPIAKYASIALGVADDYSKVMGGGQGSDTSRNQALSLVTAKQSPEQRAASIEGIRGSVGSQLNSRVGNNPVLRKMYGGQGSAATKTYQGHTYAQQSDGSWKLQQ